MPVVLRHIGPDGRVSRRRAEGHLAVLLPEEAHRLMRPGPDHRPIWQVDRLPRPDIETGEQDGEEAPLQHH